VPGTTGSTESAPLRATYRLQLSSELGFAGARALVPYLRALGVSHLYLSPSLQARPGSTHGYDVIDPGRISDALGGEQELRSLAASAAAAGMGTILDVVPNHMAAEDRNPYWADPSLRARFFDIDPASDPPGRPRRFFDIDDLAGVRQEDAEVFETTHRLVLALVGEGLVDGLRIDHPDGLADPAGYLRRLRERGAERVWIEKILDPGEKLRDWPVTGTVGYEFLNDVAGLFVDPAGEPQLTALWEQVSGDRRSFGEVALEAKLEQLATTFSPEVDRLVRELGDGAELPAGREGLVQALASLPVYRTYVEPLTGVVADADREAIAAARMAPELAAMLLLEAPAPPGFVTRFQQTTPAVTAKGVEDTAFYRYGRLLALNDVGGDPSRFGIDVETFHGANAERAERFPHALLTTMTHDAKRSADVRARIAALSSMPDAWAEHVTRWLELGDRFRSAAGAPDPVEQYFLFQTLLGAWPIELERIEAYMQKALREAKRNTSWVEQNADWEDGVAAFCRAIYADEAFLSDFEPFAARVAAAGERAALGQLALKLTAPGVPDLYQGDELEFRALVDPDNRRPVDWEHRRSLLAQLQAGAAAGAETRKLWLIWRLLELRASHPDAFSGAYEPVAAGEDACAYVRGDDVLVVVGTREEVSSANALEAPGGRWRDVLGGRERSFAGSEPLTAVLSEHGLAVFERVGR
jgi:(1->4)-alpha-D-glucan 1-alpha-D-glucosylmutase